MLLRQCPIRSTYPHGSANLDVLGLEQARAATLADGQVMIRRQRDAVRSKAPRDRQLYEGGASVCVSKREHADSVEGKRAILLGREDFVALTKRVNAHPTAVSTRDLRV